MWGFPSLNRRRIVTVMSSERPTPEEVWNEIVANYGPVPSIEPESAAAPAAPSPDIAPPAPAPGPRDWNSADVDLDDDGFIPPPAPRLRSMDPVVQLALVGLVLGIFSMLSPFFWPTAPGLLGYGGVALLIFSVGIFVWRVAANDKDLGDPDTDL